MSDVGSTGDTYKQNSRNWALFTHNIFHVTPQFDVTVGLRYTNERKKFDATFGNDNTACTLNQASLLPSHRQLRLSRPTVPGDPRPQLPGQQHGGAQRRFDQRQAQENKLTGTGVLSYKPNDDLLFYASYSRGYKAGGFNLDRSALKIPIFTFASQGGAQALVSRLQFDPEIVDAFEIGGKYSAGGILFNFALFRQEFKNFQLNTFDGTVFIVQNINGCEEDLAGLDEDQSKFSTAPNFNPQRGDQRRLRQRRRRLRRPLAGRRDRGVGARHPGPPGQCRHHLCRHALSRRPRRNGRRIAAQPGASPASGPPRVERAVDGHDRIARPGPRRSAEAGMKGLLYIDARRSSGFNTGSDLFPQKIAGRRSRWSTAASESRAPTTAGRWSSGRRTCSTRIISRSRSTRRSRKARSALRSPTRSSRADGRSSRPSSPSRGPTA